jgi:hypothetical protein
MEISLVVFEIFGKQRLSKNSLTAYYVPEMVPYIFTSWLRLFVL